MRKIISWFFNKFKNSKAIYMTVSQWNRDREKHYELVKELQKGLIHLVCDACKYPVADQVHVDETQKPKNKRQVICINPDCSRVDYRIE